MFSKLRTIFRIIAPAVIAGLFALIGVNTANAAPELPTQVVTIPASIDTPATTVVSDQLPASIVASAPAAATNQAPAFIKALTPGSAASDLMMPAATFGSNHCAVYANWARVSYMYRPNYYIEVWARKTAAGRWFCITSVGLGRLDPNRLYIRLGTSTYSSTNYLEVKTYASTGAIISGASKDSTEGYSYWKLFG